MGVTCSNFKSSSTMARYHPKDKIVIRSAIMEVIAEGELAELQKILHQNKSFVNVSGLDGRTPLHLACAEGRPHIVKFLLDKGANVDAKDRWGYEPLREAYLHGHNEVILLMLERGAQLSKDTLEDLEYKLLQAVIHGDRQRVNNLVTSGISANAADYDRRSVLHLAAAKGDADMVRFLLAHGADVHFTDRWGATAMSDAKSGNHAAVQSLLHSAGFSSPDESPLSIARTLSTSDKSDRDAAYSGHSSVRHSRGLPSPPPFLSDQRSMLNAVMEAAAAGDADELRRLVECGADPNAADYDQRTPMHLCCSEGHVAAIAYLLSAGANPAARDRWGNEPLHDALTHNHAAATAAMLAAGVRLSAECAAELHGALCARAVEGDVDALERLLAAGVRVNGCDVEGRTPLHAAAAAGRAEAVEALLDRGAARDARDRCGETALTLAVGGCHLAVQRVLEDAGARLCYTPAPTRPASAAAAPAGGGGGVEGGGVRPPPQLRRKGSVTGLLAIPQEMLHAKLDGREAEPLARECVTVLFTDIVGFHEMGAGLAPAALSSLLCRLFDQFDHLAEVHGVQKVDIIGDSYLAATNFSNEQAGDHAARMARFALAAAAAARDTPVHLPAAGGGEGGVPGAGGGEMLQIRVGLHCGPVSGTIIGTTDFKYTMMGDTVNTASRMMSTSLPDRIQCSAAAAKLLHVQAPDVVLEDREGGVEAKGKGHMHTSWVVSQRLPDRLWNRRRSV